MTTILKATPRRFVSTPAIERVATRALRYLQSGYAVHLRGPAGVGKTTLSLYLADLLARPIMLLFGDDEFKTSDLIGNQLGYTRKKVVDNFIHSVMKVEDELKQNWVDARLTLACREGFTLVYDEFNRSRPEVNNVLLSALEEKLLVLPPSNNRAEYVRVHPQFRAIFTSNPEEYCGVHDTQDALLDRMVTIQMPEPDELTQQEMLIQKAGVSREGAITIVHLIKSFRRSTDNKTSSSLRAALMIGKVCQEHNIAIGVENPEFRDLCQDVLISRSNLPAEQSTSLLWQLFNELSTQPGQGTEPRNGHGSGEAGTIALPKISVQPAEPLYDAPSQPKPELTPDPIPAPLPASPRLKQMEADSEADVEDLDRTDGLKNGSAGSLSSLTTTSQQVYEYVRQSGGAKLADVEKATGMDRFQIVDALRSLTEIGFLKQGTNRVYVVAE